MKKIFALALLLLITTASFSQSEFDKSLNTITSDLAEKLKAVNKKKIVVLYVTDINKSTTTPGKYIADLVSVNIVNNLGGFQVFDRDNLTEIIAAKKLIAEGYIDKAKAQEIGRLLEVEAIIVGTYTVLSNKTDIKSS
jgi:hypothetical protein